MVKKAKLKESTLVYQTKNGAIELHQDSNIDNIWASQAQIADIFEVNRSVITKHIRNIFKDNELDADSVCAKMAHTASDNKVYQIQVYNLDIILAVGYRVSSSKAIAFRQWAAKVLKDHITKGYTINSKRIKTNYDRFLRAVDDVKSLLPQDSAVDHHSVLELIKLFADTWVSLDAYDKDKLIITGSTKKKVKLTADKLNEALVELKKELVEKGEATDIFGRERTKGSLEGIVGNVMQAFGDSDIYPSIEEKAAHLLYFMVKNHPFVDGNKRSGAYAFIWFLRQAKVLDITK